MEDLAALWRETYARGCALTDAAPVSRACRVLRHDPRGFRVLAGEAENHPKGGSPYFHPATFAPFDEHARATLIARGWSLPVPGDAGAPEMRQRVVESACAAADLPLELLLELLNDRLALLPVLPRWRMDLRPLFAEGRCGRPEGNLLGGSGWADTRAFAHDVARVRKAFQGRPFLLLLPAAAHAVHAAHKELPWLDFSSERGDQAWFSTALRSDTGDWFAFALGSGDPRALTIHVEEPRCWIETTHDCKHLPNDPACAESRVLVAMRACVEINEPLLAVKVEKRG